MHDSYDVFDTLIGRLCYEPKIVFEIIESKYKLPNFCLFRKKFEHETCDFDKLYDKLENHYKISLSEIKDFEIDLEYQLSIPIIKYLNLVKDTDILVSDMYLSQQNIFNMLNKHKLIKNKLYVSYGDKKNNIFWKNIEIVKDINIHYGDNIISDYENPKKHNITAILVNTELNDFEKILFNINKYLSYVIRGVRVSLDSNDYMTKVFVEYILPFSIFVCFDIKHKFPNKKIIFLSRDGYWFHKIYNILFNNESDYIYFSRKLVENSADKVCEIINNIPGSKMLIDLQGSGNTYLKIKNKLKDANYYLLYSVKDYDNYLFNLNDIINNSMFPKYSLIEQFFSAPHGSAFKFNDDNNEIILLNPEYDIHNLNYYFKGVELFKNYFDTLNQYIDINKNSNYNNLNLVKNYVLNGNCDINFSNIHKYINHVKMHTSDDTLHKLKFYSQINQDKYYIENIIKFKNSGFFFEAGGYDGVLGSNTLFLEKNLGWKGLIVECNPNLINSIKQNRNCYICDNALYEKSNETIELIVPTGDERYDGKEQLSFIEKSSHDNIWKFRNEFKSSKKINVNTINIMDLFEKYKITHIDFFSLDIEGYELNILKTIDFEKINIIFFTIEYANNEQRKNDIINFLISKKYKLNRVNQWDIEFIKI